LIAGVIDRDYTGEIKVLLFNNSKLPFEFTVGNRVAQLLVLKVSEPEVQYLHENLSLASVTPVLESKKERGTSGFGSTGLK